jgi:VanZ family protein
VGAGSEAVATARPVRRPSIGLRALFGVLGLGVVLFNVALMLSDRAPGLLQRLFGDAVVRLSDRIDASGRIPADQLPESDTIVHVTVWAVATALVALTIWTWRGLVVTAGAMLAISAVVEIAQGLYSSTRATEASDAFANTIGVALGVLVAACAYLAWSLVAALGRR